MIHGLRGIVRAKGQRTSRLLGYTYLELINALGRCPELTENIDHKIPMSWFKDNSKVKVINDLRNLQILSAVENQSKNNKYSHPVCFEYFELIKDEIKVNFLNKVKHGN